MGLFGNKKTKMPVSAFASLLADGLACNHPNRPEVFDKMFAGWGELEKTVKFEWTVLDAYLMWHAVRTWFIERGNYLAEETLASYIEHALFAAMRENPAITDRMQVAEMVNVRTGAYENALLEIWHESRLNQLRHGSEASGDEMILDRMDGIFGRFMLNREPEPDTKRRRLVELALNKMAHFSENFSSRLANKFELIPD